MDCRSPYLAGQSAFAFAARPFNVSYVGNCRNTVPRSPAPQITIRQRAPNPHLLDLNGDVVLRVDSVHSGGESQHCLENSPYTEISNTLSATLHRKEILIILMRCQVLQLTLQCIADRSWTADAERLQFRHAENMRVLAYKARQLAEGLHDRGLQARSEFWAARACIATTKDDAPGALRHLKRARLLDVLTDSAETTKNNGTGLTLKERQELDALLSDVARAEADDADASNGGFIQELRSPQRNFTTREMMYIKHGRLLRAESFDGRPDRGLAHGSEHGWNLEMELRDTFDSGLVES